jgi:hypothetical protein
MTTIGLLTARCDSFRHATSVAPPEV